MQSNNKKIIVRKACRNDRNAIYNWFSNNLYKPFVSSNVDCITYDQYCKWFEKTATNDSLYIGLIDNLRFGLVWIYGEDDCNFEVLIKPSYCGNKIILYFINSVIMGLKNKKSISWSSNYHRDYYFNLFTNIGFILIKKNDKIFFTYKLKKIINSRHK
jgi:hypothetical protein